VGPRPGLDDVEKKKFLTLPGLELRPLRRPARSQSLYRLSYPGYPRQGQEFSLLRHAQCLGPIRLALKLVPGSLAGLRHIEPEANHSVI
jgi:hypothetical protein